MGSLPKDGDTIKLNGAFHTLCSILRFVVASAAEAELGALFLNCQEGIIFNSLTAIDTHERQRFNELRGTVVSRRVFIHSQSLIAH